ncbi:MAG: molybdopterin-dependent oxidoreductase, partial [Dehalococcoidia bacterium]|nr:molybdopterin-dependent oxidoreductase [Dehalococcoidia bacterium]
MTDKTLPESDEKIVTTMCASHCGGSCILKLHIKDDNITRIESDDGEEPQLRACLRGRAYRQRIYAPDRLLHPLKRMGERGEGKFEQISWDEALDTVAGEIVRVRDTYSPASILHIRMAGDVCQLHNANRMARLLALAGGFTETWGTPSFNGGIYAQQATYGTHYTCNMRDDLVNSRLIIMWGWNPAVTIWDTNTSFILAQAKEKGIRIISIDPRLTESTAVFASEWIPIRPGTDAAMLIAMAYV